MKSYEVPKCIENLRNALKAKLDWEVQYLDVKYLNDLEAEYRQEVKSKIVAFRAWEQAAAKQRDVRVLLF